MLDDVGLVHMNGRLYDPILGRMCMADRDVQAPDLVQNYNRYSYVLNNPLNAVDPSGHNWLKKIGRILLAVIIAVIIVIVASWALGLMLKGIGGMGGCTEGLAGAAGAAGSWIIGSGSGYFLGVNTAIWVAATVGATWSAVNVSIQGGTFSQVLKSAVIGAANGAVGAMVGVYMHGLASDWGSYLSAGDSLWGTAKHMAAHGVSGGAMSEANGGSFRDGFIGSAVSAGMSGVTTRYFGSYALFDMKNKDLWAVAGRTAIAGVSGGIASVAAGGKFADGAYTAAFFHLFNAELPNARPADEVRAEANPQWAELFYYPEEGGLWLLNRTTGMLEYVGDFGTGNPGAANWAMQDGGPIPPGTYSVFTRDHGATYHYGEPGYILDPADSTPFNDVIDGGLANRRSALRFHAGDPRVMGQSKGCVICLPGASFTRLNSILNASAAAQARAGTTIYRTITQPSWVKNSRSFNNETFFGALTVLRSN